MRPMTAGAIADLWKSERGLLCLVILLMATILCVLDKLPVSEWSSMVLYIYGTYVVGKTVTGAIEARKPASDPAVATVSATVTTSTPVETK